MYQARSRPWGHGAQKGCGPKGAYVDAISKTYKILAEVNGVGENRARKGKRGGGPAGKAASEQRQGRGQSVGNPQSQRGTPRPAGPREPGLREDPSTKQLGEPCTAAAPRWAWPVRRLHTAQAERAFQVLTGFSSTCALCILKPCY